jgi:two-component system, chemotaxis family, chemotaxis protein CheY
MNWQGGRGKLWAASLRFSMSQAHRRPISILVVDDNAGLRESLQALLVALGFHVRSAGDSKEAIASFRMDPPDLILTDIYMPDGDGFELIAALHSFRIAVPIIAMSGGGYQFGLPNHLGMANRMGAFATIEKPFRQAQLIEVIDRALAGRDAHLAAAAA